MASNKNQHFVPRCYLRPFTVDGADLAINLYNIDRQKLIERAPVKNQCSGSYFYGQNPLLESAIQSMEGAYGAALRRILKPDYGLVDEDRTLLRQFWLLQHLRTEAASRRVMEMTAATEAVAGLDDSSFRLQIRDAVQMAMRMFAKSMDVVADLKICLLRNKTCTPFLTSDDPAILTNRWHLDSTRRRVHSFGLHSAGAILILPLSPHILCLGYDGDVYSVPHDNGWVTVRRDSDIDAFNQHQFLNCRANVFVHDSTHANLVHESFLRAAQCRPEKRHVLHYAVFDGKQGDSTRYKVVDSEAAEDHEDAMIHTQVVHAKPMSWPRQVSARQKGIVFTNGTGLGYVRRTRIEYESSAPFLKEFARAK